MNGLTTAALSERIVYTTGHVQVIPVVFSAALVTPVVGVHTHTHTQDMNYQQSGAPRKPPPVISPFMDDYALRNISVRGET